MATLRVQRQVAPGQAPGQFAAPVSQGAQIAARDLQQAGQAVQQAGQVAAAIWTKEAEQANTARINDALNQLQKSGQEMQAEYSQLLGVNALQADDKDRPVGVVYGERMDQRVDAVAEELKLTPFQKEQYRQRAGVLAGNFRANAQEHELRQSAVYQEQVYSSGVATEQNNVLANYDSPEAVELAKLRIRELTEAESERRGLNPAGRALAVQTNIGTGVLNVVKGLADENVDAAEAFFEDHYEDMTAAQREDARTVLRPAREMKLAEAAASTVAPELGAAITTPGAPADFEQSMSLIWPSEGTALVGNDNGAGRARFGITERSHPEAWRDGDVTLEEARVIYRDKYWKPLNLDEVPAGLAHMAFDTAINMGPGAARDLLAQANGDVARFAELRRARYRSIAANDKDGSSARYLGGWLERTDRVEREAMGQGSTVATERKPTMTVTQAVAQARAALPEGATPGLIRQTEQLVRQRYAEFDRAEAEAFEAAQTAAYEWIETNKTMPPPSITAGLKPGSLNTIRNYHEAITAPPTVRSDPDTLLALTATDSWQDMSAEEFVAAYRGKLSDGDLRSHVAVLARGRTAATQDLQKDAESARTVPVQAFNTAVNSVFDMRGVDRSELSDEERQQRAFLIEGLRTSVLQEQQAKGRQLTDTEIRTLTADRLGQLSWEQRAGPLAGVQPARSGYQTSYDTMLPANRRIFRERLRAAGNTNPSEAEIYEAYVLDRVVR